MMSDTRAPALSWRHHAAGLGLAAILFLIAFLYYLQTAEIVFLVAGIAAGLVIPMAMWVYEDARSEGLAIVPWTLVTLLLPVVGFTVYLVTREVRAGAG